jgi:hypothetical protein
MSERSAKGPADQSHDPVTDSRARARFVKTLASVLGVQVITLVLLWLLQSTFSR